MKNTKLINRIAAVGGAACLALTILVSPAATVSVQAAPPNTNETQMDVIQWRFKEENGCVWRRLYNYSTNNWVGEWEYVCPARSYA